MTNIATFDCEMKVEDPASENGRIRILIAEDQPLIRRAFASIIALEPDMIVVAEAVNGLEAVQLTRARQPNVILMDLKMPRMDGCQAMRQIIAEYPDIHVVVLSSFDTGELIFDAISSGAQAYLLKDADEDIILSTIRAVMDGNSAFSPNVARKIVDEFRRIRPLGDDSEAPVTERLTQREIRVLNLVMEGRSNKEIAGIVYLAEGTVKNYVSRIMEKLNVRTRTELAVKGLRRAIRNSEWAITLWFPLKLAADLSQI
jgi:DNA-binding NarL/FixJ family response regulator